MVDLIEELHQPTSHTNGRGNVAWFRRNFAEIASLRSALAAEREAREKAEKQLRCPIGLDSIPEFCSAGTCLTCTRNRAEAAETSLSEAKRLLKPARDAIDRYADTAFEHCLVADIDALLGGQDNG